MSRPVPARPPAPKIKIKRIKKDNSKGESNPPQKSELNTCINT